MLLVHDIRETRIYQEIQEEERQRTLAQNLKSIQKMAALKMAPEVIADILDLDVDMVRKELAKAPR